MAKEEGSDSQQSNVVTIRVRVLPKGNEREPFFIQKELDVDGLEASIPRQRVPIQNPALPTQFDPGAQAEFVHLLNIRHQYPTKGEQ